jgi:hypothetical protein
VETVCGIIKEMMGFRQFLCFAGLEGLRRVEIGPMCLQYEAHARLGQISILRRRISETETGKSNRMVI